MPTVVTGYVLPPLIGGRWPGDPSSLHIIQIRAKYSKIELVVIILRRNDISERSCVAFVNLVCRGLPMEAARCVYRPSNHFCDFTCGFLGFLHVQGSVTVW